MLTGPRRVLWTADVTSDLTVFKPFFVEPALPYSIVRGETATVRVGVFNYMTEDATVSVTMTLGPELEVGLDCTAFLQVIWQLWCRAR